MATRFSDFLRADADKPKLDDGQTIDSYLNGDISTESAIQELETESGGARTVAPPLKKAPSRVTTYLIHFAAQSPEDHDAIIELLEAIYSKEDATTCPWSMRGTHDSMHSDIQDINLTRSGKNEFSPDVDRLSLQWSNLHQFFAKIESSRMPQLGAGLGLALLCFEETLEKRNPSIAYLEFHVPAASQWFLHAAPSLLRACEQKQAASFHSDSEVWKGSNEYNMERWDLWKGKWNALHSKEGLSGDTSHLARRALVSMEKAERAKNKK